MPLPTFFRLKHRFCPAQQGAEDVAKEDNKGIIKEKAIIKEKGLMEKEETLQSFLEKPQDKGWNKEQVNVILDLTTGKVFRLTVNEVLTLDE
jgi:hypothetical protein